MGSVHSVGVKATLQSYTKEGTLAISCEYMTQESFRSQLYRLSNAGYHQPLLVSVSEGLISKIKKRCTNHHDDLEGTREPRKKIAVIPYYHKLSHNLKKIGQRVGVNVVFSAPNKLSQLSKRSNPVRKKKNQV